jgi:membrane protease YdiL (CAAX protease family)
LDLVGLRWPHRGTGSPGPYSIRPNPSFPTERLQLTYWEAATSLLFGAYHWWTGIGNIIEAVLVGVLLMLFYRRSAALWPVVLAHYLTDIVDFAL